MSTIKKVTKQIDARKSCLDLCDRVIEQCYEEISEQEIRIERLKSEIFILEGQLDYLEEKEG